MPSRDVHVPVGLGTAFVASLYLSKDQKPEHQIYEAIGALFGGYWGGRLPDVFEPANNPHHRALAHSLAAGTVISATAIEASTAWSMFFREKAERLATHRQVMRAPEVNKITCSVLEVLLRVAAGVGPGLIAAYMSHLALDACTPKSLPLA